MIETFWGETAASFPADSGPIQTSAAVTRAILCIFHHARWCFNAKDGFPVLREIDSVLSLFRTKYWVILNPHHHAALISATDLELDVPTTHGNRKKFSEDAAVEITGDGNDGYTQAERKAGQPLGGVGDH